MPTPVTSLNLMPLAKLDSPIARKRDHTVWFTRRPNRRRKIAVKT